MFKFFTGVIVGIILATVGVSGVARMLDNGVHTVQAKATAVAGAVGH